MASTSSNDFQYVPLESPERQFRLLSVLPSPDGNQARYRLDTYILGGSRTPHFYAISYEWGPEHPLHEIIIDDKVFKIRSNLKDCLERFGSGYEGFRQVWIDAICIDQNNKPERNEQVKIMGQIYSSAMLVLAWFGKQAPANGTLTEAVSCLQDWQASQECRTLLEHGKTLGYQATRPQRATPPALLSLAEPYGSMWRCLMDLCQRTYWTRLWIVQELVKAKELLLMWGDEQISWNVLSAAFHTIQLNNLYIRTSEARFAPWDVIARSAPFQVWHQRDGTKPERTLLELMETYHSSDCSVPHDKAYALTGISTDAHLLQVDYDKSLPDLYVNLMEIVPDRSQHARYSHLVLRALGLDSQQLLTGAGMAVLKGQSVDCIAHRVGRVEATKAIGINVPSINVETEVLELLLMASALLSNTLIESITKWAQATQEALQQYLHGDYQEIVFFWLSSNQLGAALSPIPIGHAVYRLPGIDKPEQSLYIRVDNGEHPDEDDRGSRTGFESPLLSSPTHSQSTFFSEPETELASRVWVSSVAVPGGIESEPASDPSTSIPILLTDLVVLDKLLEVDLEAVAEDAKDSVPEMRKERRHTRSDAPRRRSTRDSASISDFIDQVMSPESHRLVKSSTWPTHTAGQPFIDALSRDLRDKLFASEGSSLNSPD